MVGIAPPAGPTNLAALDFDPAAPHGSVYFKGPTLWTFEPPGTPGQVLSTQGAAADVAWITLPGGGDMLAATYDPTTVAADAFDLINHTITGIVDGDLLVASGGTFTRLPASSAGRLLESNGIGVLPTWKVKTGDMLKSTYDPTTVNGDAFDLANMRIASEALGDMYFRDSVDWARLPIPSPAAEEVIYADAVTGKPAWKKQRHSTNHIDRLNLKVKTVSTIEIGLGKGRTDNDAVNFEVTAPITVDITASGAGGLDTGVEAVSTWYDVYVIRTALGVTNGLLVVRGNVPVLPAGFFTKRRVGTVRNDAAGNFRFFVQHGGGRDKTYLYLAANSARTVLSGGTATTPTAVGLGALVPNTTQLALLSLINASGTRLMRVYQDAAGAILEVIEMSESRSLLFPTNASQQIAYDNDAAGGDANVEIRGYVETI